MNARANSFYMLLMTLAIAIGVVMVALLTKIYPLFVAKTVFFCQQFISHTLYKIPQSLAGASLFAISTIVLIGTASFLFQLIKARHFIHKNSSRGIAQPKRLRRLVMGLDLAGKVQLIADGKAYSFCYGLRDPRIILSTGLLSLLTEKELEAVLLHEQAHLNNRDPLKILLGKTIGAAFFFLPLFRELNRSMEAMSELIADHYTTQSQCDTQFLRGALRKIIAQPLPSVIPVSGISHPDYIEIRIRRLAHPQEGMRLGISLLSVLTTLVFAAISLFVLQTPINAFHIENSQEPTYVLCSADDSCKQECRHSIQSQETSPPSQLFGSQLPTYQPSSYK